MIFWGVWAIFSGFFHEDVAGAIVNRLGLAYDGWGLYFLLRIFIQSLDDVVALSKIIMILLVPVAFEMLTEAITGKNSFSVFGGVGPESEVRNGAIRAQGPFAHSILAGTVGAVCLPLSFLFWKKNRVWALVGLAATCLIILSSRSSGPMMTAFSVLIGVGTWKIRTHMRLIRRGALCAFIGLAIVMKAPVYYILARIDLTGSSTGYHRAALIESAIAHLSEWWFSGTDYTRAWMASGVGWSEKHTDITNHYLKMGVIGGLPLTILFSAIVVMGFVQVGKTIRALRNSEEQFLSWTLGATLFGHAVTMISISYFDQSVVFLYLPLAAIASVAAVTATRRVQPARSLTEENLGSLVSASPPMTEGWSRRF